MAVEIGTATSQVDLYRRLNHFLLGYGTSGSVSYAGTGNGTLTKGSTNGFTRQGEGTTGLTITETWTVTCTAAAADGGTFSVVGSVSGAQAAATVGVAYDNGKVLFTIADGTVDFIVGDYFTFTTTRGAMATAGNAWTYVGTDTSGVRWLKAPGLTGTENIYISFRTYADSATDVYNMAVHSATGFNAGADFYSQPGKSADTWVGLWNDSMPYWFVANGQRVVFVAKVSTTYHAGYVGKILPYGTPTEYPYPVYVGGEFTDPYTRWSSVNEGYRHFVDPGYYSAYLCFPSGVWREIGNFYDSGGESGWSTGRHVWPYGTHNIDTSVATRLRELRENIDGTYTLLPTIIVCSTPEPGVFGEIDGCYYVAGYGNAAENIVTIGGADYLVVQNVFRTARPSYWALKLE